MHKTTNKQRWWGGLGVKSPHIRHTWAPLRRPVGHWRGKKGGGARKRRPIRSSFEGSGDRRSGERHILQPLIFSAERDGETNRKTPRRDPRRSTVAAGMASPDTKKLPSYQFQVTRGKRRKSCPASRNRKLDESRARKREDEHERR